MDNQTELIETRLGIRLKFQSLDQNESDEDAVHRHYTVWTTGLLTVRDTLDVPHVRQYGDNGDTDVEEGRIVIETLWFEREGRDIEKDEMKQLQTLCEKAMQAAAAANGVRCTPLPAKYVRKVEYLTFEDLSA